MVSYLCVVDDLAGIVHHTEGAAVQLGSLIVRVVAVGGVKLTQQRLVTGSRETENTMWSTTFLGFLSGVACHIQHSEID